MFTGIVQSLGKTVSRKVASKAGISELILEVQTDFHDLTLGESVAINGVCLTVIEPVVPSGLARFFVSSETLEKTQLQSLNVGDTVNLERALRLGDRLSGHLVQGHVDTVGKLTKITPIADSIDIEIQIPSSYLKFCIEKGSITLDGVSLTINKIQNDRLTLRLIPHTWTHTRFCTLQEGASINIEVDMMAKYALQSEHTTHV